MRQLLGAILVLALASHSFAEEDKDDSAAPKWDFKSEKAAASIKKYQTDTKKIKKTRERGHDKIDQSYFKQDKQNRLKLMRALEAELKAAKKADDNKEATKLEEAVKTLKEAIKIQGEINSLPEGDSDEDAIDLSKSRRFKTQEAADLFGLAAPIWKVSKKDMIGRVGSIDQGQIFSKSTVKAKEFSFGFKIKSPWYHAIYLRDTQSGQRYACSIGHWSNTGTMIVGDARGDKDGTVRFRGKGSVLVPDQWYSVSVTVKDNVASYYYDGKLVYRSQMRKPKKGRREMRVGFASHETIIAVKDFYLEIKKK